MLVCKLVVAMLNAKMFVIATINRLSELFLGSEWIVPFDHVSLKE